MTGYLSSLLSGLAGRLPQPAGRSQRRCWAGHGRAHIEVKGVGQPANADFARRVEEKLCGLEGVQSAQVNPVLGRVVVDFDDGRLGVDDLTHTIEAFEEAHGLASDRFPHDRPDHPADVEPLHRQLYAIGADIGGLGLGLASRMLRVNPLLGSVASVMSLVEATPVLRRPLESQLGHAVTDLGLAAGNALAQGLAQGTLGLMADVAHRSLLVGEILARREAWERREPGLYEQREADPLPALSEAGRATPLRGGPVESYTSRAAQVALAGAGVTAAVTRDARAAVTAAVAATPKAARLGREAFAALLGRDLARRGVLVMDAAALRRLDRIDKVLIDAELLATGRANLGSVWVSPEHQPEAERIWLTARALLDPANPGTAVRRGEWALGPTPKPLSGAARQAARELRAPGRRLLALRRAGALAALVATEPELDPLAGPLVAAARAVGTVAVAGLGTGVGERVHADEVVPGGAELAASVRALQDAGAGVAVIAARHHDALAAADLGIGVPAGSVPPWGAALLTNPGLADACRILQAIKPARAVSKRAAVLAGYGSGAGALLALAGPRARATQRALLAVNGAAIASLGGGAWSAMTLVRQPAPLPSGTGDWHALTAEAVLATLASTEQGIDDDEAARRRARRPAGAVHEEPGVVRASLEELANPLTPALASGAGISAASGSVADAALIGVVMAADAFLGGVQRVGAGHALRRLIDESAVRVRLRRHGGETLTTADQLVPGDVITVQAGDAVPADCRVLHTRGLEADESSLTGESLPIAKTADPTAAANIADRRSMLYAGSTVAAGTATAVVVAVGPETELGRSTETAQDGHQPGGVQARLRELTRVTVPVALGAGAAVVGAGLLRGRPFSATLGTGVSLAVAAVPEGLPVVATVAQLAAARRLARRNALVRNPGTIEALGRVDVLCFDKTGTLTEGRSRLHCVYAAGVCQPLDALDADGRLVLAAGLRASPEHRDGESLAHSTDRAVVEGGTAAGVAADLGTGGWQQVSELPFEPSRGYHAVLGRTPAGHRLAVKGAPETILPLCTRWQRPGTVVPLGKAARQAISDEVTRLARDGYRVLAVAEREASGRHELSGDRIDRLRFLGLLALADPVRGSATRAVRGLRAAGVNVMMLTGDHPTTAAAIAAELGLLNGHVATGQEIDALADPSLDKLVGEVNVFARVSPDHKARIVAALRRNGRVVAVTGDGANDAPAIRLADVGVALGLQGTNAAKEAADVVVTDDQIETIIDAIVEGRAMWAAVRDAIAVLLGGNLGEIAFTVGTGLLLPGGSPLNARQLLLVNLLTDMLPSMALAVRPPGRLAPEALLSEGPDVSLGTLLTRDIAIRAALTAGAGSAAWLGGRVTGITSARAGTVALVGIVGAQLGQTLAAGWHSPLVVAASLASVAALAAVIQTPGVSHFFGCRPLGPVGWGIAFSAAAAAGLGAPLAARLFPPPEQGRRDTSAMAGP